MADKSDVSGEDKKPSPLPLIIAGVVVFGIIVFFLTRKKRVPKRTARRPIPKEDPCKDLPDWACGTVALLNPLAKTSVDVFKAQQEAELQKARLKA